MINCNFSSYIGMGVCYITNDHKCVFIHAGESVHNASLMKAM